MSWGTCIKVCLVNTKWELFSFVEVGRVLQPYSLYWDANNCQHSQDNIPPHSLSREDSTWVMCADCGGDCVWTLHRQCAAPWQGREKIRRISQIHSRSFLQHPPTSHHIWLCLVSIQQGISGYFCQCGGVCSVWNPLQCIHSWLQFIRAICKVWSKN